MRKWCTRLESKGNISIRKTGVTGVFMMAGTLMSRPATEVKFWGLICQSNTLTELNTKNSFKITCKYTDVQNAPEEINLCWGPEQGAKQPVTIHQFIVTISPGEILFNIFINYMCDVVVFTISNFANYTELGEVVNTPDGWEGPQQVGEMRRRKTYVQQREKDTLLGRSKPRHHDSLWKPAGKQFLQKRDLYILVNNRLTRSQQCVLMAKKTISFLGCDRKTISRRSKKVILLFHSALVKLHLKCWIKVCAA